LFSKDQDLEKRKYIFNTLSISTVISIAIFIGAVLIGLG
jgi:hypothetical protein